MTGLPVCWRQKCAEPSVLCSWPRSWSDFPWAKFKITSVRIPSFVQTKIVLDVQKGRICQTLQVYNWIQFLQIGRDFFCSSSGDIPGALLNCRVVRAKERMDSGFGPKGPKMWDSTVFAVSSISEGTSSFMSVSFPLDSLKSFLFVFCSNFCHPWSHVLGVHASDTRCSEKQGPCVPIVNMANGTDGVSLHLYRRRSRWRGMPLITRAPVYWEKLACIWA